MTRNKHPNALRDHHRQAVNRAANSETVEDVDLVPGAVVEAATVEAPTVEGVEDSAPGAVVEAATVEAPTVEGVEDSAPEMVRIPGDLHRAVGGLVRAQTRRGVPQDVAADIIQASASFWSEAEPHDLPHVDDPNPTATAAYVDALIRRQRDHGMTHRQAVEAVAYFLACVTAYVVELDPDEDGDLDTL